MQTSSYGRLSKALVALLFVAELLSDGTAAVASPPSIPSIFDWLGFGGQSNGVPVVAVCPAGNLLGTWRFDFVHPQAEKRRHEHPVEWLPDPPCRYSVHTAADLAHRFAGRRVLVAGDSISRHFYYALLEWAEGCFEDDLTVARTNACGFGASRNDRSSRIVSVAGVEYEFAWVTHLHGFGELRDGEAGTVIDRILASDVAILGSGFWHVAYPSGEAAADRLRQDAEEAFDLFAALKEAQERSTRWQRLGSLAPPRVVWRGNFELEMHNINMNTENSLALDAAILRAAQEAGFLGVSVSHLFRGVRAPGANETRIFTLDGIHPLPRVMLAGARTVLAAVAAAEDASGAMRAPLWQSSSCGRRPTRTQTPSRYATASQAWTRSVTPTRTASVSSSTSQVPTGSASRSASHTQSRTESQSWTAAPTQARDRQIRIRPLLALHHPGTTHDGSKSGSGFVLGQSVREEGVEPGGLGRGYAALDLGTVQLGGKVAIIAALVIGGALLGRWWRQCSSSCCLGPPAARGGLRSRMAR
jgi:hypothetical protein